MIFQATWQAVLSGRKTITRRIVKPREFLVSELKDKQNPLSDCVDTVVIRSSLFPLPHQMKPTEQIKWQVDRTYAVQPGRGQKAVGRIRLLEIRQERLQEIDEAGAIAEGVQPYFYPGEMSLTPRGIEQAGYLNYIKPYRLLWNSIHTKRGERWDDNPLVWVLRFERVETDKRPALALGAVEE